jgi:putative hydrolase of the HAD superfamily
VIEVVVVDLGGVAARFRPERRLAALASLGGVSEAQIQDRLFDSGFEGSAEPGEYTPEQVIERVRSALEQPVSSAEVAEAWSQAFEPDREIIDRLGSLSVRKVIFTNNGPMLDACLAGPLRELAVAFGEVICSWHVKACKPNAAAFERVAQRLSMASDRLLLLDDSAENVAAAKACGWNAEYVSGIDQVRAAIERWPELQDASTG